MKGKTKSSPEATLVIVNNSPESSPPAKSPSVRNNKGALKSSSSPNDPLAISPSDNPPFNPQVSTTNQLQLQNYSPSVDLPASRFPDLKLLTSPQLPQLVHGLPDYVEGLIFLSRHDISTTCYGYRQNELLSVQQIQSC